MTAFFNILNRASFGLPNRVVFASSAGAVSGTTGRITTTTTSRQVQFALRLLF